jgi:hypothetical protein
MPDDRHDRLADRDDHIDFSTRIAHRPPFKPHARATQLLMSTCRHVRV